jgi:predicted nucleic acid-binding Zn ribbon protein
MTEPSNLEGKITHEQKGWLKLVDVGRHLGRWSADESYEPVEGVRQEDVGRMKQYWADVNGHLYCHCYNLNFWANFYSRPLTVPY